MTADDLAPDAGVAAELRILLRLAAPLAVAQLALMVMGLVDTAFVGHASVDDLAGVGTGRAIGFAASAFGIGAAAALEPLASQAIGAREPERAWAAYRASIRAAILIGLASFALAWAATWTLAPLGVDPRIVPRVRGYLLGYAPAMTGFTLFLVAKTFVQAHGRTGPVLASALVANVVNTIACALLVQGDDALAAVGLPRVGLPRWGAFGAGVATSLSTTVLAAMMLLAARAYRPAAATAPFPLASVLRLGLPVGLSIFAEAGVFSFAGVIAGRLGAVAVSAHQIAIGLASFTFMGALGVSGATAVRVGWAIGAGRSPRRSGLLGIGVGGAIMLVGAAVFAIVPQALVGLFTPDPDVRALGVKLVRIAAVFQLFDGVQAVANGALRGAGDVRVPFAITSAAYWFVATPVALALGFGVGWGALGLWWGLTLGLVLVAVLLTLRFERIARRKIERVR